MARLIGEVAAMFDEAEIFCACDPARWTARWLSDPMPALGGRRPGEFMSTLQGQTGVADLLAMARSGAFAQADGRDAKRIVPRRR